jgi:hypothetical protein
MEEDSDYLADNGWEQYGDEIVEEKLDEAVDAFMEEHGDAYLEEHGDDTPGLLRNIVKDMVQQLYDGGSLEDGNTLETFVATNLSIFADIEDIARAEAAQRAEDDYNQDPHYENEVRVELPDGETFYENVTEYSYGEVMRDGESYDDMNDAINGITDEYEERARDASGESNGNTKWGEYNEVNGENEYREVLLTVPQLEASGPNKTVNTGEFVNDTHFEAPNIVVHARLNERLAANGDKVLFVEEVQADLSSDWRKRGGMMTEEQSVEAFRKAVDAKDAARAAMDDIENSEDGFDSENIDHVITQRRLRDARKASADAERNAEFAANRAIGRSSLAATPFEGEASYTLMLKKK